MEPKRKPYLLTGGIVPLLENRHGNRVGRLSDGARSDLRALEHAYYSEARLILDGRADSTESEGLFSWDVRFVPDEEIDAAFRGMVPSGKSRPMVTFDDVYCTDLADGAYHVTRLVNPNRIWQKPKLGPRFAAKSLDRQAAHIRKTLGEEVDIMDIGSFEAQTLCGEVKRFRDAGIEVKNVYLAFAGAGAVRNLEALKVNTHIYQVMDWVDWVEIRDCMGLDGRKVPLNSVQARRVENSFVRYIERSDEWASIPVPVKSAYEAMYHQFFGLIQRVLSCEHIDLNLKPSPGNHKVHDLTIRQR